MQITEVIGQKVTGTNPHLDLYFGTQDNDDVASADGGVTWPYTLCCEGFYFGVERESNNHSGVKVSGKAIGAGFGGNFISDAHLSNAAAFPNPPDGDTVVGDIDGEPFFIQPGHYIQNTRNNSPGIDITNAVKLTTSTGLRWTPKYNIEEDLQGRPIIVGPLNNPTIYQPIRRGTTTEGLQSKLPRRVFSARSPLLPT